jgi:putative membrane protein
MARARPEPPAEVAASDRIRDHLANERTFLAWLRSAVALLGFGFVVARVGLLLGEYGPAGPGGPAPPHGGPMRDLWFTGVAFVLAGIVLILWAGRHYARTRAALLQGRYTPALASVYGIVGIAIAGGLLILAILLRLGNAFVQP